MLVRTGELRAQWGPLAATWAIQCNSRHVACRSHQVYRALSPKFTVEACQSLLHSIHRCLMEPDHPLVLSFALEAVITLQQIVSNLHPNKLILYPQLFWACVVRLIRLEHVLLTYKTCLKTIGSLGTVL